MKKENKVNNNVRVIRMDKTERNKKFEKICTKSQPDLKEYLKARFTQMGKKITEGNGYLFIDGTLPVLLTAHMDTVHKELPKEIIYDAGMISSPQGIGGDDRCGIYMILQIVKELDCPIIFCEDEETGGIGSGKFVKSQIFKELKERGNICYVIELDRKGKDDAVYYDLDNADFEAFVEKEFWKGSFGSFSDICNICPALGVAGVNLSCGYYNAHTTSEAVDLSEMEKSIEEVKKLIKRTTEKDVFLWKENVWSYKTPYGKNTSSWYSTGGYGYGSGYNCEENFYIIYLDDSKGECYEFVEAQSDIEAVGYFLMYHPTMTYRDILEVGYEEDLSYSSAYENFNEDDDYDFDVNKFRESIAYKKEAK